MSAETKRCPYCGEEILAVAKKCKYCGEWLDREEPKKEPKKMVQCPVCGEDIEEGTEVCPYCHEHTGHGEVAPQGGAVNRSVQTTAQPYAQQAIQPHSQPTYSQPQQQAYGGNGGHDDGGAGYEYDDEENVGLFNYYYVDVFFRHYADFSGKLGRKRFWLAYLFNALCATAFMFVSGALFGIPAILFFVYQAAVLVPSLAYTVRRLHDTGKSGWWVLLGFIPIVGQIALLVLLCMPGEEDSGRARATTMDYVIIGVLAVLIVVGYIFSDKKIKERRMLRNKTEMRSDLPSDDKTFTSDDEAISMLADFYKIYLDNENLYNNTAFFKKYCSKHMLEIAYGWDCRNREDEAQGYLPSEPTLATVFQPSSDFDGRDIYPKESFLSNIERLGDSNYYKVQFLDNGFRAEVVLRVVKEDGTVKIDDVSERWIED